MMNSIKKKILFLFSIIPTIFSTIPCAAVVASADEGGILSELEQDSTFSLSDWPKNDKLDMDLIDFKETINDKCAVFIYNPTGKRTALKISICFDESNFDNIKYNYYDLTLLDETSNHVIQKYLIEDVSVDHSKLERYYIFGAIQRDVTEEEKIKNDSIIYSIGLKAGELFRVTEDTKTNTITYYRREKDILTLTDQFRFRLMIANNILETKYTNAECIVFNTDYNISDIVNIDVEFVKNSMNFLITLSDYGKNYDNTFEALEYYIRNNGYVQNRTSKTDYSTGFWFYNNQYQELIKKTITSDDTSSNNPGWFKKQVVWNCIDEVANFKSDLYFKKNVYDKYQEIRNCKWFLNYFTSDLITSARVDSSSMKYYDRILDGDIVTSVVIVRMTFVMDGNIYNWAVVDDVAVGRKIIVGEDELPWWFWLLLGAIVLLFFFIIGWNIIWALIKALALLTWKAVKFIFKCIINIISAPFKFINKQVKKSKKKKRKKGNKKYDW